MHEKRKHDAVMRYTQRKQIRLLQFISETLVITTNIQHVTQKIIFHMIFFSKQNYKTISSDKVTQQRTYGLFINIV